MGKEITVNELAEVLQYGCEQPVCLGKLEESVFARLNKLRESMGESVFVENLVWVYPNVVKKLQRKRVKVDKRTPLQSSDSNISSAHFTEFAMFTK